MSLDNGKLAWGEVEEDTTQHGAFENLKLKNKIWKVCVMVMHREVEGKILFKSSYKCRFGCISCEK